MGFVNDWTSLAALRVILGIMEAGFFPGSVYLLSTWYVRYEVHKRYSVFYIIGCFASALAGILAYGLMQIKAYGYLGWRWIFIIEGCITVAIAIVGYFFLVNFPEQAAKNRRFLTPRQLRWIIARVNADRADAGTEPWSTVKFLKPALNIDVWGFGLIFCFSTTVSYAMAYFLPVILQGSLGFSVAKAQCLVAPPFAAAAIQMYFTAWVGDKYHIRGPIIAFNTLICIIGLPIMGFHSNPGVRYFGTFFVCMGCNANVPATLTFQVRHSSLPIPH